MPHIRKTGIRQAINSIDICPVGVYRQEKTQLRNKNLIPTHCFKLTEQETQPKEKIHYIYLNLLVFCSLVCKHVFCLPLEAVLKRCWKLMDGYKKINPFRLAGMSQDNTLD